MDGFLLVDKPVGMTSHDVVTKVRNILRTEIRNKQLENRLITNSKLLITPSAKPKVGHTGTLDPLASGLMILVLGSYTKRAQEFSKMGKTYEAELTLGFTSATGDEEGKISRQKTVDSRPEKAEIEKVIKEFIGKTQQTPPIYSAVKVNGQRAYKLARQGKEVKLEPREITVYSLQSTFYRYPKLCLTARVSSGTYIRSLAEDIGQKLGTGAYVSALRRTKIDKFDIKDAQNLQKLDISKLKN